MRRLNTYPFTEDLALPLEKLIKPLQLTHNISDDVATKIIVKVLDERTSRVGSYPFDKKPTMEVSNGEIFIYIDKMDWQFNIDNGSLIGSGMFLL